MPISSILFVVNGYPTKEDPIYTFIRPVVCSMADRGVKCIVIAPQSITKILVKKSKRRKKHWTDATDSGNPIEIIQPMFFSFSNAAIGNYHISSELAIRAIRHALKKYNIRPELIYAHFWECGIKAAKATKWHVPVVVATGESKINVGSNFSQQDIIKGCSVVSGVISVSTKNLEESKNLGLISDNASTIVLPNGIDGNEFFKIDKRTARRKIGINDSEMVAAFVGDFCERKGVLRLAEAAKSIPNLKLILIGAGPQEPDSERIVFKGKLPHDKITPYLNAADVFVLPTLAEGCCNAIIEAMACGLPIISSNLPFNDDILDETNSIRIDPNSVDEIRSAIQLLQVDRELREKLAAGALKRASMLRIENRAQNILNFMNEIAKGRYEDTVRN